MKRNALYFLIAGVMLLSSATLALDVTNYQIQVGGGQWWSCSWVSAAGNVYSFYQGDRGTNGYDIVGRQIIGTSAQSEFTVLNDDGTGWYSPTIRGTAGYLAATGDNGVIKVIDLNNGNNVVYSRLTGGEWEPRIHEKTLVYSTNNAVWMVPDVTNPVDPIMVASGSGWMGHSDIDGDYVSYQWNDGAGNRIYLYQISTGQTKCLTGIETYAPHIGGGHVVWQHWDGSANILSAYDIATGTSSDIIANGWFNDTIAAPLMNEQYMVFGQDNNSPGTGADVMVYEWATGAITAISATGATEWGPSLCGNRVSYGFYDGGDQVYGAVLTPEPSSVVALASAVATLGGLNLRRRAIKKRTRG